jgi:SAM-dependent methyltransferase
MSRRTEKKKSKKPKKQVKQGWRTAKTSDRHELYELSVQNVDAEIDFVDRVWERLRGRTARTLREDFCGTFAAACEWLRRRDDNTAIGVDLDEEVLDWGRNRNLPTLDDGQRARLEILQRDVRDSGAAGIETVLAMNFSYFLFKTRDELRTYFASVHRDLADDGILICDAYGGSDSYTEMEEERNLDGFTYVWDQNLYDPITGDVVNHIHFRFPDGSEMTKAFTYEWRLWSIPEIRELMLEAGFRKVTVWWEGTDEESGDGDGEFEPAERGEACPGWIAYFTAEK